MNRSDLEKETNWENKKFYIDTEYTVKTMIDRIQKNDWENHNYSKLIIPEYQRDFVWKDDDVSKVLLSLYKGFPIGNIILWDNGKREMFLIDGLQRNWALLKINEKPLNYLSFSIYKKWCKNNFIDFENEKEFFRHLKSKANHKNNNYKKAEKEELINWLSKTTAESGKNKEIRKKFEKFLNEYCEWFERFFLKINIPHVILDNFKIDDVTEVFQTMNSTGKPLNKFEIVSSIWSKYKITLEKGLEYITVFNNDRKNKYFKNFENIDEKQKLNLSIGFDNIEIIPSNFIFAVFLEAIKNNEVFKSTFISKNEISTKAIEPICEIIKWALIKRKNISWFEEFEDLGKKLSENIKNNSDVDNLVEDIRKTMDNSLKDIQYLNYIVSNKQNKSFPYPTWLISTIFIHYIKNNNKRNENYKNWFIWDLVFDNRFNSSTGVIAKKIIENKEYDDPKYETTKKTELKIYEKINLFFKEESETKINFIKYDDRKKIIILSFLQTNNMKNSKNYNIDHLIPTSKFKKNTKLYKDSIFNLQILPDYENKQKKDDFTKDQIKWDIFKSHYTEEQKEKISNIFLKMSNLNSKDEFDENLYNEYLNIRKEVYEKIIKEL